MVVQGVSRPSPWLAPLVALAIGLATPLRAQTFGDVQPPDWAYQALLDLQSRYGCVGPQGGGRRSMTRFEAAVLLQACLQRVGTVTDALRRLSADFAEDLAQLKGQVNGLAARVAVLEAQQFSTSTRLQGEASMVLAAPQVLGTTPQVAQDRQAYGGWLGRGSS